MKLLKAILLPENPPLWHLALMPLIALVIFVLYFGVFCWGFWIYWLDMPVVGWIFAAPIGIPVLYGAITAKENVG